MDDYARQEPILCQIASPSVECIRQHRAAPQPVEIVATIAEALSSLKCLNASAVPRRKATSLGIGTVGSLLEKHERLHRRARLRSSRRPVAGGAEGSRPEGPIDVIDDVLHANPAERAKYRAEGGLKIGSETDILNQQSA